MIKKNADCKLRTVVVIALTMALVSPLTHAQTSASAQTSGMSGSSSMPASGMDMKAMMKDMNDKMSAMQMSGNQDVDFAMMMRIHHQGAIAMAQAELGAGKEPKMKKMAKDIIAAQKKEIAEIDKFLARHAQQKEKKSK